MTNFKSQHFALILLITLVILVTITFNVPRILTGLIIGIAISLLITDLK